MGIPIGPDSSPPSGFEVTRDSHVPPSGFRPSSGQEPTFVGVQRARETLDKLGRVQRAPWFDACRDYDVLVLREEATFTWGPWSNAWKDWSRIYTKAIPKAQEIKA
jgi:hypothetical protein